MARQVVAVLAVHNEEATLPLILPTLEKQVDRIAAVLDNCTDRSEQILRRFSKVDCWRIKKHCWRNFRAETKNFGIKTAKYFYGKCLILMVDCDVLLDAGSVEKAKQLIRGKDAVVFAYEQYSLDGGFLDRVKDEVLNLFGRLTRKLTRQPVARGLYLVRSEKACMEDVTSDYETMLSQLDTAWMNTGIKHLRPRYDRHTQQVMGLCRATLGSYNLRKVLVYSLCTLSPHVASGFLTAKLRGVTTVDDGSY